MRTARHDTLHLDPPLGRIARPTAPADIPPHEPAPAPRNEHPDGMDRATA